MSKDTVLIARDLARHYEVSRGAFRESATLKALDGASFTVDRGKTLAGRWGCWTIANAKYWWLFGFDQLLHQATNIGLSALLAVA